MTGSIDSRSKPVAIRCVEADALLSSFDMERGGGDCGGRDRVDSLFVKTVESAAGGAAFDVAADADVARAADVTLLGCCASVDGCVNERDNKASFSIPLLLDSSASLLTLLFDGSDEVCKARTAGSGDGEAVCKPCVSAS